MKKVYEITIDEKYDKFLTDWIGWYADKIELMRILVEEEVS